MTYHDAINVTTQKAADEVFKLLTDECMRLRKERGESPTREKCENIQRSNLGYYAGYFSNEVRERVERLYKCEHPIFGAIAKKGPPTPEQAFAMGLKMGKASRRKKKPLTEPTVERRFNFE